MKTPLTTMAAIVTLLLCGLSAAPFAQTAAPPRGVHSFGGDQTIADLGKIDWAPLQLPGLPPGRREGRQLVEREGMGLDSGRIRVSELPAPSASFGQGL